MSLPQAEPLHPRRRMPRELGCDWTGNTRQKGEGMATNHVDALVIFGTTGDLAKLETFPALVGLVDRGVLDVPVIGVAKSGWGLYAAMSEQMGSGQKALYYLEVPPSLFGQIAWDRGREQGAGRQGHGGEAVRRRPGLRAAAQRDPAPWRIHLTYRCDGLTTRRTPTTVSEYSSTGWGRAGSAKLVLISMSGARRSRPQPTCASGTTPTGSTSSPAATLAGEDPEHRGRLGDPAYGVPAGGFV